MGDLRVLNIGCGYLNRNKDEVGIDVDMACKPNVCADAQNLPFKDGSFAAINAVHVLEHIPNIVKTMNECYRVLQDGGEMTIRVPGFPNVEAVQDPTHIRFFVPETFGYFTRKGALTGLKHTFKQKKLYAQGFELICLLKKEEQFKDA